MVKRFEQMAGSIIMMEWLEKAECRGSDPELFFPSKLDSVQVLVALQLCMTCQVQNECFEVASSDLTIEGIWGGTTQDQRKQLSRRQKR